MGFLHIPLNREVPISDLLSDMPATPKAIIRKGFSVLAKVPESAHSVLLKGALSAAERRPVNEEQLAKDLRITTEEATSAVTALGMFSALAAARSESAEKILEALVESGLVSVAEKSSLLRIAPKITQIAPQVSKAVTTQRLTDAVLPSFDAFEAVLDIRIGDEERGGFALPVAIAFLDTDAREHRLWFQLTRQNVEDLAKKLSQLLKRFKEAEDIIAKWPSSAGGA